MGFNKRFVDINKVNQYLNENKGLDSLFKADAFIFMDKQSSDVYKWYEQGLTEEEIKNKIIELDGKEEN